MYCTAFAASTGTSAVNLAANHTVIATVPSNCHALVLQEHMVDNTDVLPRQGFSQMARNMRCQLYFPHPTDQVILLRTGVLHHINSYMQALGLTPPSESSPLKQPTANGLPDQANANVPGAASNGPAASAKGPMAANGGTLMADTAALPGNSDTLGTAQRSLTDAPNAVLDSSKQADGSILQQNSEDDLGLVGEAPAAEASHVAFDVVPSAYMFCLHNCAVQTSIFTEVLPMLDLTHGAAQVAGIPVHCLLTYGKLEMGVYTLWLCLRRDADVLSSCGASAAGCGHSTAGCQNGGLAWPHQT